MSSTNHTVTTLLDFEKQHNLNTGQLYTLAKSLSTTISEVMKQEKERATIQANYIDALSGFDDDIGAIVKHTIKQLTADLINKPSWRTIRGREEITRAIENISGEIRKKIDQPQQNTHTLIDNLEQFSIQNKISMTTTQSIVDTFGCNPYETINTLLKQVDINQLLDTAIYLQHHTQNNIWVYKHHLYNRIIANKENVIQYIQSYTGEDLIKLSEFFSRMGDEAGADIIEAIKQQRSPDNTVD